MDEKDLPPEFLPTPKTTPPRASPTPGYPPGLPHESPTNPGLHITAEYLWNKLDAERAERAEEEKRLKNSGWIRTAISVATVLGAVGTGFLVVLNEARAQARQEVARTDAGMAGHEARIQTVEKRVDRIDDKLDLVLDALRVPEWKRPKPVDGGSP